MYTKEDLANFKQRGIKAEVIDRQLANFEKGFDYVSLSEPATIDNGILQIQPEEEEHLIATYEDACQKSDILKMVPASGSAVCFHGQLPRDDGGVFGVCAKEGTGDDALFL